MKKDELNRVIRETVRATLDELRRNGQLRPPDDKAYSDIGRRLSAYFNTDDQDEEITAALAAVRDDRYYDIIPLYYAYHYTIEKLAEDYGVEPSTITRNKKRLCMQVWKMAQGHKK